MKATAAFVALASGSALALLLALPALYSGLPPLHPGDPAAPGWSMGQRPASPPAVAAPSRDADDAGSGWADPPSFRVISLSELMPRVAARFPGRLLAATLAPPEPDEQARGVALVYDLRMLSPDGDMIRLRVDARDGAFLDIAARDLLRAQRRPAPMEPPR